MLSSRSDPSLTVPHCLPSLVLFNVHIWATLLPLHTPTILYRHTAAGFVPALKWAPAIFGPFRHSLRFFYELSVLFRPSSYTQTIATWTLHPSRLAELITRAIRCSLQMLPLNAHRAPLKTIGCRELEHKLLLLALPSFFQCPCLRLRFPKTGSLLKQTECYYLVKEYLRLPPVFWGQPHQRFRKIAQGKLGTTVQKPPRKRGTLPTTLSGIQTSDSKRLLDPGVNKKDILWVSKAIYNASLPNT